MPSHYSMRGTLTWLVSLLATAAQAQAPAVTRAGLAPAANARAAARNTTVVVPFSQALDPATAGNIRVYGQQYRGRRTATAALSNGGSTATLTPTAPAGKPTDFRAGETVTVSVPATVQSTSGVGTRPQVYQFTAAATGGGGGFVAGPAITAPRAMAMMQSAATSFVQSNLAIGDIDGDGDLDMVCGGYVPRPGYLGGIGKYTNDGTGTLVASLSAALPIAAPTAGTPSNAGARVDNPQLGDVDGDGDLDLLLISGTNSAGVYYNGDDATGTNTGLYTHASATYVTLPGTATGRVMLGDVDGDGDPDLAVPVDNGVAVRLNGGDATGSNTGVFANGSDLTLTAAASSIQFGDVDGDGDLDLVVSMGNTVTVRLNGGDATGSNTGVFANGSDLALTAVAGIAQLGDVDGDGDLDLAVPVGNGVAVRLNGGDATGSSTGVFANGSDLALTAAAGNTELGDMDGDGDLDLLVVSMGNTVAVRLNGGDATGSNTGVFANGSDLASSARYLLVSDFDGDGDLDVLSNGSNRGNVYKNSPPPAPTVASLAPDRGPVGTSVVITGTNFTAGMTVSFNGTAATFVLNSTTQLTAVVPAGATTGLVTLTNAGGTGTSAATFTVLPPSLTVSTGTLAAPVDVAAGNYYTITISAGGVARLVGAVNAGSSVQVSGTLLTNCQPLTGTGSFTLAAGATLGICDPAGISSTGTSGAVQVTGSRSFSPAALYIYNGTQPQQTGDGLPGTVDRFTLDNAQGAALMADLTVTNALALTNGVLTTGSYAATLGASATLAESAASYITGTVQAARDLNAANVAVTFGGLGLTLTPDASSTALPGSTLVRRVTGTALSGQGSSGGIKRYYDIQPTVNAGLNVRVELGYFDAELNGIAESNLAIFRSSTGLAGPWQPVAVAGRNAAANTITATAVEHFSIWTLGNASAPLPVQLVQFTAEAAGPGAVRLAWATATEKNSARFEVERSPDGKAFAQVGEVAAAGTSTAAHAYVYTDAAPAGTSYYRLRQGDADGTASYSPVRTVTLTAGGDLTLAPNPTRTATLASGLVAGAVVEVFDALGRPVLRTQADAAGQAPLTLPAGLAPGVYVVRSGARTARLVLE